MRAQARRDREQALDARNEHIGHVSVEQARQREKNIRQYGSADATYIAPISNLFGDWG